MIIWSFRLLQSLKSTRVDFFKSCRHESFVTYTPIMLTTVPPLPPTPPHISNKLNHATFHNVEKFIVTADRTSKHRVVPPTARFRPGATQFSRPQRRHYTDRAVRGTKFNLYIPVTQWESVKNNNQPNNYIYLISITYCLKYFDFIYNSLHHKRQHNTYSAK